MVEPIFPFNKILIKGQYTSTHIVFIKIGDRKRVIWLNLCSVLRHFWPWLSRITVILSTISLKTIWVEPYCLLIKIFLKGNMGWTILCRLKFSNKIICSKQYCLLIKIFLKDNTSWQVLYSAQHFVNRQYGLSHIVSWSKLAVKTIHSTHIVF